MLFVLIVTIHIVVSLIIIALVLLQAGKGADIGSAFASGLPEISSAPFT